MNKKVVLAFMALVFLISCGPNEEFLQLEQDFTALEARASEDSSEIANLESNLEDAKSESASKDSQIEELQSEIDSRKELIFQYSNAMDTLICDRKIENMSYDTILEATSRLEAYVNGEEFVQYTSGGYRDTIYDNADSKIHAIRYNHEDGNQYIMTFLVYFDEFGWEPSTLNVDYQCWADPPTKVPTSD